MQKKTFELLELLCQYELKKTLESCPPEPLTADDVMSFLWPLNARFRPLIHQIRTVRYRKQYEREADKAIREFVLRDSHWENVPLVVWRVLLERHQQAITVCVANKMHASDTTFMHAPFGLTDTAKTKFAVVWLCYAMKLPYPVHDESQLDIETSFENLSLKPH